MTLEMINYVDILQTLFMAGVTVWLYWRQRHAARKQEVDEKISAMQQRVTAVEQDMRHAPTDKDLRDLSRHVEEVHGDLKELSGTIKGLARAVDLINTHLLDQKNK